MRSKHSVKHLLVLLAHHHEQQVAFLNNCLAHRNVDMAIVLADAGDDKVVVYDLVQVMNGLAYDEFVGHFIGYKVRLKLRIGVLVFNLLRLLVDTYLENRLEHNERQENAHHAKGIGGSIAHRHRLIQRYSGIALGLNKRLLSGTQAGSVSNSTRENSHHVGDAGVAHAIVDAQCNSDV